MGRRGLRTWIPSSGLDLSCHSLPPPRPDCGVATERRLLSSSPSSLRPSCPSCRRRRPCAFRAIGIVDRRTVAAATPTAEARPPPPLAAGTALSQKPANRGGTARRAITSAVPGPTCPTGPAMPNLPVRSGRSWTAGDDRGAGTTSALRACRSVFARAMPSASNDSQSTSADCSVCRPPARGDVQSVCNHSPHKTMAYLLNACARRQPAAETTPASPPTGLGKVRGLGPWRGRARARSIVVAVNTDVMCD